MNENACAGEPSQGDSVEKRIIRDLSSLGHYLFVRRGGQGGKQHVLKQLYRAGGAMNQRDLLGLTRTTSASLSEVVGKLESEGLVERERCARDKRQLAVTLTPEGSRRAEELVSDQLAFERESLSCLTGQEREELLGMLDRINEQWQQRERTQKGATE